MTDSTGRDEGSESGSDRFDRRFLLKSVGGVSLIGGGLALSAAAGAGSADDGEETEEPDSTTEESGSTAEEDETYGDVDEDLPPLECGRPLKGELTEDSPSTGEPGGRNNRYYDVYPFEGTAGERLNVYAVTEETHPIDPEGGPGAEPRYAGSPAVLLLDADGEVIGRGEETGYFGMDFFDATLPYDGDYRFVVTSAHSNETFEYSFSVNCRDRTPVVDDPPEPVPIECGETVEGEFHEGDEDAWSGTWDVFAFDGACGDVVTISAMTDETPVFPRLFDPDGRHDPPTRDPETNEFDPRGAGVPVDGGYRIADYELPKTGTYTVWINRNDRYDYQYDLTLECTSKR